MSAFMKGERTQYLYIELETKAYPEAKLGQVVSVALGVHRGARLAAGTTPRSVAPVGALPSVSILRN